jgi:tetratricopeptide (TPR) repeat protein
MSTFVLHPPEPLRKRVWIVSFFITARLAAQDRRDAFTIVLQQQLADLIGQELPPVLDEATREAHLLKLLDQAAHTCQAAGGRLVLVVDGLDEDRGVTTGPYAHSIAGLLPARPPAGMRIIVAGRPNPPIPADVEPWHPLRDKRIIRPLQASPYAQGLKQRSEQELRRLLNGAPIEQDLFGLLTAARGGLSGPDLKELTGASLWEIEDVLRTVVGRTFTRRVSMWRPEIGPEIYLLGHEELQATATHYLGDQRLADYRDRLHTWADTYRANGWPSGTPEYLLSGYYRLVTTTGDLPRLIACATDVARHDRMLDLSGGDTAAFTETRTALDLLTAQDSSDVIAAFRLAHHRDQLTDRNINTPIRLPAVWASLGRTTRAEALADSIPDPDRRASALAGVAQTLAEAGQTERATQVAEQAEMATHSITHPAEQVPALAAVAQALAEAGQTEWATEVAGQAEMAARSITDDMWDFFVALVGLTRALAVAGRADRAEAVARSITAPRCQAEALAAVAQALAGAGQPEAAAQMARQAEAVARSITDRQGQAEALAEVAQALAGAGQPEAAAQMARQAEVMTHSITDVDRAASILTAVAQALARSGETEQATQVAGQAETVARSIAIPRWREWNIAMPRTDLRVSALTAVAKALARGGEMERAEAVARSITDPRQQAQAFTAVARLLVASGQAGRAEALVRSLTGQDDQASALHELAGALARAGDTDRAETVARSMDRWQVSTLHEVACALVRVGKIDRAEAVARSHTYPYDQAEALAAVSEALVQAGQAERAVQVVGEAERVARSVTDPAGRDSALFVVARALARLGQAEWATAVARSITTRAGGRSRWFAPPPDHQFPPPPAQSSALSLVAEILAQVGELGRAESVARSIATPDKQADGLAAVAQALAQAGEIERAEAVARSITTPSEQAKALTAVAQALAETGQAERAEQIAGQADTLHNSVWTPSDDVSALIEVAKALVQAGQAERAEAVARSITTPHRQAEALTAVAQAWARAEESEQARRVAAAVCVVQRWSEVAELVLSVEPSAAELVTALCLGPGHRDEVV